MKFLPKIDDSLYGLDFGDNRAKWFDFIKKNTGKTLVIMTEEEFKKATNGLRTDSQNKSLHLYLTKISEQLQNEGHTIQDVVRAIKKAEIIPTMILLKEVIWKPSQEIMFGKKSTKELRKIGQIEKVHMVVDKFFSDNFGATYPFPSDDEKQKEKIAPREKPDIEYPENNLGESKF